MPFFGKKKKKKKDKDKEKPPPPPRAETTRLSVSENIYVTVDRGQTIIDSAGQQNVHSAGPAAAVNNVPIAPARQGSSKKSAPAPPPRAGSSRSSLSDSAPGFDQNVTSTVVYNEHYDGSIASSGTVNGDSVEVAQATDEQEFAPWQITPVEEWNDEDVLDWLQAVKLDYFVEIFEGCGIDGDYLMQVTEEDLIDLEIDEEDIRIVFLKEVDKLKKRPKAVSMLKLQYSNKAKQHEDDMSVRMSGELETLLKLQEAQESRIDADIAKLKEDQKRAGQLISSHQTTMQSRPDNVQSSHVNSTDANTQQGGRQERSGSIISPPMTFTADGTQPVPVEEWTDDDVVTWLEGVGLSRHAPAFKAKHITGKGLAEIDLQLFEDMNIKSANDREEVLSKIYELLNPSAAASADQLLNEARKSTGYERQKYMAAVSALNSHESVQLPPPSQSNNSTSESVRSVEQSDGHKTRDSKKKSSSGLSKLKEAISPKKKDAKDANMVQIWSNSNQSGKFQCESFHATDSTTTEEMIHRYLESQNLIEDHRLYSIVEFPLVNEDPHDPALSLMYQVPERELRANEQPLQIQKHWPSSSSYRYELRQKQGTAIKVVDRISGHKAKGKTLTVSASTPCYQVLQLSLRKFDMKNVDASLFCLLEVASDGDIRIVQDMEIPSQLNSNQFILCDKTNVENQIAETEGLDEVDSTLVSRHSSSISQNSKVSSTSSKNSSKMASIEVELSQNLERSDQQLANKSEDFKNDQLHVRLAELERKLQEQQDELQMNREHLRAVEEEKRALQQNEKKFKLLQKTLSQLQESYQKQQTGMRKKLHQRQQQKEDEEALPLAVADLKGQLDHTTQEVQAKEKELQKFNQELDLISNQSQRTVNTEAEIAELEYKIAEEESSLVKLQQKQMSQFTELELTTYEHQIQQEKSKIKQQSTTLHSILPLKEAYTVVAMEMVPGHYGYDFIVSSSDYEDDGVFVTSCDANGLLQEGDRLLEVNGVNVFESSDAEVNTMLNSKMSAKIVVLREQQAQQLQPIKDPETTEKMNKLRQELSLAAANLEEERKETGQLRKEVARLQTLEMKAKKADAAEIKINQLQKQLSDSEAQYQDLENIVEDLQKSQQRQSETENSLDQLQKQNKILEVEIKKKTAELAESAKRLGGVEAKYQQQERSLAAVTVERDELAQQLENTSSRKHNSVVYLNDDDLPVWEVLKTAQKSEILDVLRENIEESTRQKKYLDKLYAVMLDQAPSLLDQLDEVFDEEDMSGDEEFC
ncbi:interaptin-like isoform X2 [Ptychodera flava]|uniref:interaptin-like isoform X2 n=1 Tax=Ptychodera flava TaxID=63121 RepID=UPI00396A6754